MKKPLRSAKSPQTAQSFRTLQEIIARWFKRSIAASTLGAAIVFSPLSFAQDWTYSSTPIGISTGYQDIVQFGAGNSLNIALTNTEGNSYPRVNFGRISLPFKIYAGASGGVVVDRSTIATVNLSGVGEITFGGEGVSDTWTVGAGQSFTTSSDTDFSMGGNGGGNVATGGSGTMTINGGTVIFGATANFGGSGHYATGGAGTLDISGGTARFQGDVTLGGFGSPSGNGKVTLTGGTTVLEKDVTMLLRGNDTTGFSLTGGTFQTAIGTKVEATNMTLANTATLAFDMTDATAATTNLTLDSGNAITGSIGSGAVNILTSGALPTAGTYTLVSAANGTFANNGLLKFNGSTSAQDRRATAFSLSTATANELDLVVGSTMAAKTMTWTNADAANQGVWSNFVDASSPHNWTDVPGGTATVTQFQNGDTVNFNSTYATPGTVTVAVGGVTINGMTVNETGDWTFSGGAIGGSGGLTMNGSGTVTLSNDNTYTGGTTINAGTLRINGDQTAATGAVTVASGATLRGSGTTGGDVTIADGGHLLGVQGQTLTMNALTLDDTSQIDVSLAAPSATELFNISGALVLDGKLNITATGAFGPGTYALMQYSGALTNNGLELGNLPAGFTTDDLDIQTSVLGQVNLLNASAPLSFWDGGDSALYDNNAVDGGSGTWVAPAANNAWTDSGGAVNAPWQPGNFAIFQATPGTVTVDNSSGNVTFGGAQFAVDGYTITGNPLTTTRTNTILRVGNGTSAGAAMTATIDAVIQGTSGIYKTDLGTLILTNDNIYTGDTTVNSGTLQIGNGGTTGSVTSNVAVDSGGTVRYYRSDNSDVITNTISGAGTLRFGGTGVQDQSSYKIAPTSAGFTGSVIVESGARLIAEAATSANIQGTTVENDGQLFLAAGDSFSNDISIAGEGWNETAGRLGALRLGDGTTASGAITLTGNAGIGDQGTGTTGTISGVIGGNFAVTKVGTGTLILTGNNTYTGGTFVNAGTLTGTGTNAGSLAVASGATFAISSDTTGNYTGIVFAGSGTFDSGSMIDTTGIKGVKNMRVFGQGFTDVDAANAALTLGGNPFYNFTAFNHNGLGYFGIGILPAADISDVFVNSLMMHHYRTIRNAATPRFADEQRSPQSQNYRGQDSGGVSPRLARRQNAWVNYIGRTNHLESNFYNGQEAKFETNGIQLGYDLISGRCTQFGVMFGYEDHQQRLGNLGDKVKGDDYYFGLYGEQRFVSASDLRGYLGYGHQSYDLNRFQTGVRHAADFDGNTFEANLELGRTFYRNRCFSFRPVFAIDLYNNNIGAAQEDNGGTGYSQASLTQTFARIGSDFNWNRCRWGLNGGAYYSYQLASNGDVLRTQVANGVDTLWAYGSDLGNSAVTLNAGATYYLNSKKTCAVFGNYYADFYTDRDGSPMQNSAVVGLQYRF